MCHTYRNGPHMEPCNHVDSCNSLPCLRRVYNIENMPMKYGSDIMVGGELVTLVHHSILMLTPALKCMSWSYGFG